MGSGLEEGRWGQGWRVADVLKKKLKIKYKAHAERE